ncbi:MAG: hypothetical protein ACHQD7_08740 [Chitinophagales bacterium]
MAPKIQKDLHLATDMKKYLVITIDVEPDCSSTWHYADPLGFKAVSEGIAKILQPLFNEYDITPTYLINNVVLEDDHSVETFLNLRGKYELGTHLHPEFIEPFKKYNNYAGKKGVANCCFYPPEIESEKIKNITTLFEHKFGYKPVAFRAGRYSAGSNTISSLARLGYLVDTSITPHLCWNDVSREKPVDFTTAPEQPYFVEEEDITKENTGGKILEVPISIALKKRPVLKEFIVAAGGLRHALRKHKPVWLRPYYSSAAEMIELARQYDSAYQHQDRMVLNMMFHNVEVMPGLSPYTKSEATCKEYLEQMRIFFNFCRQEDINSVGSSDLHRIYENQ